jgi:hypothetical protein
MFHPHNKHPLIKATSIFKYIMKNNIYALIIIFSTQCNLSSKILEKLVSEAKLMMS